MDIHGAVLKIGALIRYITIISPRTTIRSDFFYR